MRLIAVLLLILFVFILLYCGYAQVPEKVIIAEGMAGGSDLKARDEALNRALRQAVEEGVGTIIDSESITQNYQLLDDKILSQVKGYVKSYNIISDNNGAGGVYRIRVEAVVALFMLEKDIKALNIIREKKNNPRVMILVQEFVDGLEQPSELVQSKMEKEFLEKSFPLVDKSQFQMAKERDVALNYSDPEKAVVLGREFGAEVVVVGQATCNLTDSSISYGEHVFAYTADISTKAIKTDTAAIIANETASATEFGSGRIPTANKALGNAAGELADVMIAGIVERWRSEVFNTVNVQLVIENMEENDRAMLKGDLSAIRGVQSVNERTFDKNILVLDLVIDGAIWQGFEQRLLELQNIKLQLVSKTENRIQFKKPLL